MKSPTEDIFRTLDYAAYEAAFRARLEYEENCIRKYDRVGKPSLPIPKGERMEDFAYKWGVSIEEMKRALPRVESELNQREQ